MLLCPSLQVKDMAVVLHVVSWLEKATVTAEDLRVSCCVAESANNNMGSC